MRCLYCQKRIPLLRKLSSGEYCSDEHRLRFLAEQERMALARLVEAQQRFSEEAIHVARISAISEEEYPPALFFMPDGPWARADGHDRESTVESEPPEAAATLPRYESKPAAARWKPMQLLRSRVAPVSSDLHTMSYRAALLRFRPAVLDRIRVPHLSTARYANRRAGLELASLATLPTVNSTLPPRVAGGAIRPRLACAAPCRRTLLEPAVPAAANLFQVWNIAPLVPTSAPFSACLSSLSALIPVGLPGPRRDIVLDGALDDTVVLEARRTADAAGDLPLARIMALEVGALTGFSTDVALGAGLQFAASSQAVLPQSTATSCVRELAKTCSALHAIGSFSGLFGGFAAAVHAGEQLRLEPVPCEPYDAFLPSFAEGLVPGRLSISQETAAFSVPAAIANASADCVHPSVGVVLAESEANPAVPERELAAFDATLGLSMGLCRLPLRACQTAVPSPLGMSSELPLDAVAPQPTALPAREAVLAGAVPEASRRLRRLSVDFTVATGTFAPSVSSLDQRWPTPSPCSPAFRLAALVPRTLSGAPEDSDEAFRALLAGFWKAAPAHLQHFAMAIPLVLGVVWFIAGGVTPSPKRVPPGEAVQQNSRPADGVLEARWEAVRQNIVDRAAIELYDDFRSGLSSWEGKGDWAKTWSYDGAGFARTGSLALYAPSLQLTDYQFEFLGQIEKKGLSWVVRAQDPDNYYVTKIVITRPGPLPGVAMIRYAVIGGEEGPPQQIPLAMSVRNDMLYRVRVEVRGDNFTTFIQGQVVDSWSDDRLKHGGIGFFSSKGERSLLRWITVSHHYDALGRLCAYLAPFSLPSRKGEWSQ